MKKAKFLVSHFDAGVVKFKAGQAYPLDDETRLCIVRGAAEEVDVEDVTCAETGAGDAASDPGGTDAAAAVETADEGVAAATTETKPAKAKK
jgi:hypothetical protein